MCRGPDWRVFRPFFHISDQGQFATVFSHFFPNRYRPKGVFGKGVGKSQKCVRNASKMRQNGSCFYWERRNVQNASEIRQKCVKNASVMRGNTFGGEHLLDDFFSQALAFGPFSMATWTAILRAVPWSFWNYAWNLFRKVSAVLGVWPTNCRMTSPWGASAAALASIVPAAAHADILGAVKVRGEKNPTKHINTSLGVKWWKQTASFCPPALRRGPPANVR